MREPPPDYSSRQYERPNQPWVCGMACDGQACPAGPTARGQCPALAECVPARDGDRWQCNRSALRGGECTDGPTPDGGCGRVNRCQPVRSLRAVRGRFVSSCAILSAGGLLILLSADWRDDAISPGPLARQHAQLLGSGPADASCAACHAAAERSAAGWAMSLLAGHGGRPDQTQRCLECHKKTIPVEFARMAHSVPPDLLQQISANKIADPSWVGTVPDRKHASADRTRPRPGWSGYVLNRGAQELACAACHREHHGAEFDLAAMNDAACQSCHRRRFESFGTDHPDFGAWPYERRTRIAFNHASHSAKHFAETKRAFDCRSCHLDDATGRAQLLASYETACASCHDEKIATSVAQGLPMLVLPTLDVEALKAAGHDIGPWPAEASGDFDGQLTPVMKLLLAGDRDATRAIATLGADFDFFDVDPDDAQQLEACAILATAIKTVLEGLSNSAPRAAGERLRNALAVDISDAQLNALFAGLPAETLRTATNDWLRGVPSSGTAPQLQDDAQRMSGSPQSLAYGPAGTWTRDDATLSIRYRPVAHADPVLTAWLELLAAAPQLTESPIIMAVFNELSKPTSPGLCVSCHSIERTAVGQLMINWRALDRTKEPRGFTNFSHGPHLVLPQLADCTHCHAIVESKTPAASYTDWNPESFVSEFAPVTKRQCVECHTARRAGDGCQKCHNYHVEGIESWRLKSTTALRQPAAVLTMSIR